MNEGTGPLKGPILHSRTRVALAGLVLLGLAVGPLTGCAKKSTNAPETVAACPDDPGILCTWAGNGETGFNGDGRPLQESSFYWPIDLTITPTGVAYLLDWNNHRVRQVTAQNTFQTVIGSDFVGDGPPDFSDLTPPGAPGTTCQLNHPTYLEPLDDGSLLLVAWHNHKLRHYAPSTGLVLVTCGSAAGFAGDGGPAKDALVNQPSHAVEAVDKSIYILDQRNQRIRKIDPSGQISTVAGSTPVDPPLQPGGFSGDGGPPLDAEINQPTGPNPTTGGALALDAQGRLYIADVLNHRIRRIDFGANRIETVAGSGPIGEGNGGYAGDGGAATSALLNGPRDIEFGPDGRLYIADELNHRVRALDLMTGIITTVAGTGTPGFSGDGGPAINAQLNHPQGIEFDPQGRLYIVDTFNQRVRRMRLP